MVIGSRKIFKPYFISYITSMDFETFLVVRADWTLLAVASTLADILR